MSKEKKEVANLLSLVFIASLAVSMFSYFYNIGIGFGSIRTIVLGLTVFCVILYLAISRISFFYSRAFAIVNLFASLFVSVLLLSFSRQSRPVVFGNSVSPVYYVIFSIFLMMDFCGNDRKFAVLSYLVFVFSAVMLLSYDISSVVLLNTAALIYVFLNGRDYAGGFVVFELLLCAFVVLVALSDELLVSRCLSAFGSRGALEDFTGSFGLTGLVFEIALTTCLLCSLVHDRFTLSFSVFVALSLILSFVTFNRMFDFDFSFLSNSIFTLLADTLILGIISNREKSNGKQEVSGN